MNAQVQQVAGRARGELDAATLHAEVDPRNLLEEVHAQLRIGGAWMSESGVAQRCRLARSRSEVIGALIELKRQGCAEEGEQQAGRPLWRTVPGKTPEITLRRVLASIETTRAAEPAAAFQPISIKQIEGPMPTKNAHGQTAAALISALSSGPLTRDQLSKKTGIGVNAVTSGLNKLKIKGRVRRAGHRTWELTSGAAIAPGVKRAGTQHAAPPRRSSSPLVPTGGQGLRWFLGSDGSVRIEQAGAGIDLTPEQFDTLKRAHQVVTAARPQAEV